RGRTWLDTPLARQSGQGSSPFRRRMKSAFAIKRRHILLAAASAVPPSPRCHPRENGDLCLVLQGLTAVPAGVAPPPGRAPWNPVIAASVDQQFHLDALVERPAAQR